MYKPKCHQCFKTDAVKLNWSSVSESKRKPQDEYICNKCGRVFRRGWWEDYLMVLAK